MLQALDTEIGRFMDSLAVYNQLDSTDFIFIGDNGNTQQTAQIANLSKAKGTVYEYGVHVPFIISGPSVVNPGRVSDALVNVADIYATVLELFGNTNWQAQIPTNKPVDSKSILPIIQNQAVNIRDWAFCENFKITPDSLDGKGIRNMEYKLIRFDDGTEQFYNLTNDPEENTNLLDATLSPTEVSNYYYLCNEMTNLVGVGTFCSMGVGTEDVKNKTLKVYPNPFKTHIYFSSDKQVALINELGQILFIGTHIEKQDFSALPKGIYFLKVEKEMFKLVKE